MRALFTIVVVASIALSASAEPTIEPEKDQAIRELMAVTGSVELGNQLSSTLLTQLRPAFPQVPDELWEELTTALDLSGATDMIVAIYDRHFELADIKEVLAFYATPVGKKILEKMPVVMEESMAVGNQWGKMKAMEIIQRLAQEGYEPMSL